MLKFVTLVFAILAIAAATNYKYPGNEIVYDVTPNEISPMPYYFRDGYKGRPLELEASPLYTAMIAPEILKPEPVSFNTSLIATVASHAIACVKSALSFLFRNFSALFLGSAAALGFCKITSLCSQGNTLLQLKREIRSLATPQRIKRATEFVESAIRKYNAIQ